MYENITQEVLLERMLARIPDTMDKRPSSIIYDTHSATAIELQNLYIELEYLMKNSFGDTAEREYLILLCKDRGITPDPATHAVLKGVFAPENIDVTGQRFNAGNINYIVKERIAPGEYQVECETAGNVGNQYMGDIIPMEYIRGLQTAELTEVLIPGEDEEETEALRQRYFDSFDEQAFGGNRADYISRVNRMSGVGGCKVTRVWNDDIRPAELIPSAEVTEWYNLVINGAGTAVKKWLSAVYMAAYNKKLTVGGTVLVTVVDAALYGAVSETLLDRIQSELDPVQNAGEGYGIAPIGHIVTVKSAEQITIDVKTDITFEEGYQWNNLKSQIAAVVSNYLLELRKGWADSSGLIVRISQIESRILAIKGVTDITNTRLNGTGGNVILGPYEIPVTGEVGT